MSRNFRNSLLSIGKFYKGLTLLELLVTLIIVALVVYAALLLLRNTDQHSTLMRREMEKLASIRHSMDRLIDDLTAAAAVKVRFEIERESFSDGRQACHLTIISEDTAQKSRTVRRIEWVAVPRFEQEDLVLFRREKTANDESSIYYVPMCENLNSFDVQTLNAEGEPITEKEAAALVAITARVFREGAHSSDRVFTVSRTFCLDRYQL